MGFVVPISTVIGTKVVLRIYAQYGRERAEPRIVVQPPVVNKVYVVD
jgi:hypothetical protein